MNPAFWRGRRVLLTGHTGFKGSWLALWLRALGAEVTGFALPPATTPSLFELAGVGEDLVSLLGDVRDASAVEHAVQSAQPEIILHMAAQALVRASYAEPVATFATNVMGTAHLLDAVRRAPSVRAVLVVTTDKVYLNREQRQPYREDDPLGGRDPYSASKACAEIATAAWRDSFFAPAALEASGTAAPGRGQGVGIATARAGNVIGGGDWSPDRLLPDVLAAFRAGRPVSIRRPQAVRPWQHVLDPLQGYLLLAERLYRGEADHAEGWNFGPRLADAQPVSWVVERMAALWGPEARWEADRGVHPHEAGLLCLDAAKAHDRLGWQPRLDLDAALTWTVEWARAMDRGADARALTLSQIDRYSRLPSSEHP